MPLLIKPPCTWSELPSFAVFGWPVNYLVCLLFRNPRKKKKRRTNKFEIVRGWQAVKNITIRIDDNLYRRARMKAAEQGTSISALFRDFLIRLTVDGSAEAEFQRLAREEQELRAELGGAKDTLLSEVILVPDIRLRRSFSPQRLP